MISTFQKRSKFTGSPIAVYNAYDPTRTTTLRNEFVKKMDNRFTKLCNAIITKVID